MTALPPAQFDADRFQRLLDLVGPEIAPDLLGQLVADLTACRSAIQEGLRGEDWDALRQASHILMSLSGSAGAMGLHGMAQALNSASHALDLGTVQRLVPGLDAELQALIALVRATHGDES